MYNLKKNEMSNHLTQIIMEAFPTSGSPHVACPCCILNDVFALTLLSVFFPHVTVFLCIVLDSSHFMNVLLAKISS